MSLAYPAEYRIKSIPEQVAIIRKLLPGVGSANEQIAKLPLPVGADGWFAFLKQEAIGRTYREATEKVLGLLKQTRNGAFHNYYDGRIGPRYLRQSEHSIKAWKQIEKEQAGHDILIVPAQFGLLYSGHSATEARAKMAQNEFGLGALAAGIMLATHTEREVRFDQMHIDCVGDEFSTIDDNNFTRTLFFFSRFERVTLCTRWFDGADPNCGPATAFLLP